MSSRHGLLIVPDDVQRHRALPLRRRRLLSSVQRVLAASARRHTLRDSTGRLNYTRPVTSDRQGCCRHRRRR